MTVGSRKSSQLVYVVLGALNASRFNWRMNVANDDGDYSREISTHGGYCWQLLSMGSTLV